MITLDHDHELSASEARSLANRRGGNPNQQTLLAALDTIREAARQGHYAAQFHVLHHEAQAIHDELEARGYHLTAQKGQLRTTLLIAWSKEA